MNARRGPQTTTFAATALATALASGLLSLSSISVAREEVDDPYEEPAAEVDPKEAAARALFDEAMSLAQQGRWAEARTRYQRSIEVKYAPETLYSLGVAQKQTGAYVEALASFEAFLDDPPSDELKPFRAAALRAIEELERQIGHVSVRVTAPPDGLSVLIDDEPVDVAEARQGRRVNPGHHTVEASAPGATRHILTVEVTSGEREVVPIDFTLPAPAPLDDDDAWIGWTLIGSGAGVATAGLVTGLAGVGMAASARRGSEEASDARTMAIAGDVVAGVGVLAAGVGLIFVLHEPGDEEEPTPRVALSGVPGGLGLNLEF